MLLDLCIRLILIHSLNTGTNVGEYAIDLKFNNPEGEIIALSELKGQMVLLIFGHPGVDHAEEKIQTLLSL